MIHPTARAAKRDLIGRLLSERIPILAGRVYQARVWPMKMPELPALLVYGWEETKTRTTLETWTHQFEVSCKMAVRARLQAATGQDAERAMEFLAGEIEAVILTSPELLGLTGTLERIDRVDTQLEARAEGESVQAGVSLVFDCVWTEVQQIAVPPGEQPADFGILTTPIP